MFSLASLTVQFGPKPLFESVSVKFEQGGRYGLIGANGSGKTTLMKVMSGILSPTSGTVVKEPSIKMAALGQDQFAFEDYSVIEAVMMGEPALMTVKTERDAIYALPDMSEEQGMRVAELEVEFAELDGYTAESRAAELLSGVGISQSLHHMKMSEIAPGLKLRILLTQVLFADPDIMLLDEPTNNLDIDTIRWLEQTLNAKKSTMIIISHDRHFLNTVCTHTADLDYNTLTCFPGNYDAYMVAATAARERSTRENTKKLEKIKELKHFVSRFSANASKAKQATSRARQIDKIKLEDLKPSTRKNPFIQFTQEKKLHRLSVEVAHLTQGYEDQALFEDLSLMVEAGERIAVIGPNGIGKTTLFQTLVEEHSPMSGLIKWAENASIGYLPQDHKSFFEEPMTVFEWMSGYAQVGDDEQVIRGTLGRMLFSNADIEKPVSVLSGGERVRMMLGRLILEKPNVLLLDEPTNHLDMESIESLQLALENYPGTLFFVSHDRTLVSSIATRILHLKNDGFIDHKGTYEEYLSTLVGS